MSVIYFTHRCDCQFQFHWDPQNRLVVMGQKCRIKLAYGRIRFRSELNNHYGTPRSIRSIRHLYLVYKEFSYSLIMLKYFCSLFLIGANCLDNWLNLQCKYSPICSTFNILKYFFCSLICLGATQLSTCIFLVILIPGK